jgi:cytochrome P450
MRRNTFDPVPELARMREEAPLHRITLTWGGTAWLATRYQEVRQVLGDTAHFSNTGGVNRRNPLEPSKRQKSGFLLGYDPPDHNRLRRLLTPQFTVARMRKLRPRVETIVAEHLAAMAEGTSADVVADFALPVPSLVICELLGVPYSDREEFQRLSRARLDMSQDFDTRVKAAQEAREYMSGLVAEQRRSPGDGLVGGLVREHGTEIDDEELTGVVDLLLLAGHETTSNMLGLGTLLLLLNPDQLALLLDPERTEGAVEELLRYLSVVPTVMPRTATVDVEVGGQVVKAGESVLCSLPAANRDPEIGADLEHVDLNRAIAGHLAFGHGIHHCLGAPLARMEMRIAYPALFSRFPTLRLAVPADEVPFRAFSGIYGLSALPVTW